MLSHLLSGRYRIVQHLRSGGFTDIYLAQDENLPNSPPCIVKQLKPRSTDPETLKAARRLFDSEAKVLSQLGTHDQIPRLLAYFEENQEFYLVEELIDGDDLGKDLDQGRLLTEAQVTQLLHDVLIVLQFVHQQGVIHRDIKPANIIRRRTDGRMVLTGFGAVKQINTQVATAPGQTSFVVAIGTAGYMPNEQQGGMPRFSSDIYALGMTAIHALTGVHPQQLSEDPNTGEIVWRSHVSQISKKLATILDKMVRSHFRDRYQTTDEVLRDLQASQTTRKPMILALSAVGILVAVGVTAGIINLTFQERTPEDIVENCQPRRSAEFVACGQARIELGQDYEQALADFEAALERDPELVVAWTGKGDALSGLGRYDEAIEAYDRALELDANQSDALSGKGWVLYYQQNYDEAVENFDQAVAVTPNDADLWNDRSLILYTLGRYDEAVESADKAIELDANHRFAWSNKGDALFALERFDDAIAAYTGGKQVAPNNPYLWERHGDVLQFLEKYDEAVEQYDEAIAIGSSTYDYSSVWSNKGYALVGLGQTESALEAFNRAVDINPNSAFALAGRGQVLNILGRHEAALASADQALELNDTLVDAWLLRSSSLLKLRQVDEALAAADQAIEVSPDDPLVQSNAWNVRANALYEAGRLQEALPAYQMVVQLAPDQEVGWSNLAELFNRLKRYEDALNAADRALQIEETTSGWNQRGNALAGLGRYQEAIDAFDEVLELFPNYHYAWVSKGNAFTQLGQYEQAIEAYDQALAIQPADRKLQDQSDRFGIWNQKGNALFQLKRYDEALEAFKQATTINAEFAEAWFNQGRTFYELRQYDEALDAYERALTLKPDFADARARREQVLRQLR